MPGISRPEKYPIRDSKTRPQKVGRIVNPIGFPEMGGLDGPGKWGKGNEMRVEKPTSVKGAKPATKKD